jgi:hypothetical protein
VHKRSETSDADVRRVALPLFLTILVALGISAASGIQLFQDGSSYLLEMLVSGEAIRHNRIAALLIQAPAMAVNWFGRRSFEDAARLQMVAIAFRTAYVLVPLIVLIACWLIVRGGRPDLFVWPTAIVLLVNAPNFSSVSELLIAVQACCPLMLAAYIDPGSMRSRLVAGATVPFIFFLHPLVFLLFVGVAAGSAVVAHHRPGLKRPALGMAALLTAAAALRIIVSLGMLTSYERDMLQVTQAREYFFLTSIENLLFLIVACLGPIGLMSWRKRSIRAAVAALTITLVLVAAWKLPDALWGVERWDVRALLSLLAAGALLNFAHAGVSRTRNSGGAPAWVAGLLWLAALVLVSQYFAPSYHFPLKTGLSVVAAIVLMLAAAFDSARPYASPSQHWRAKFILHAAAIFAIVMVCKSAIWAGAMDRLRASLAAAPEICVERDDRGFEWLGRSPETILDNWALSSLVLLESEEEHTRLLLEPGACAPYYASGAIKVDPWTVLRPQDLSFVTLGQKR